MSTYVLIHGAWHGSWCWEKVVRSLRQAGHKVEAPDLAGHGSDTTPAPKISLRTYVDHVCGLLDAQPEPVFLVGHSMGGVAISQAAEHRPDRTGTLVYVSGNLLRDGGSLFQVVQRGGESLVTPNLVVHEELGTATIRKNAVEDIFYNDCPREDAARAASMLSPEPLAPFVTPPSITEDNFGRIPRVYIECLRDRANSLSAQRSMYAALPCHRVVAMDTGHSPFLSAPEELVTHLSRCEDLDVPPSPGGRGPMRMGSHRYRYVTAAGPASGRGHAHKELFDE